MNLRKIEVIERVRECEAPPYELSITTTTEILQRGERWVNLDTVIKLEPWDTHSGITVVWLSAQQNVFVEGEPDDVARLLNHKLQDMG